MMCDYFKKNDTLCQYRPHNKIQKLKETSIQNNVLLKGNKVTNSKLTTRREFSERKHDSSTETN